RFAPILVVARARQQRRIQNSLLLGGELPTAHTHLFLELHHLSEKFRELLFVQTRQVEQQPQNRLAFVGKQDVPVPQLLPGNGLESNGQALQQAFVQGLLKFLRQFFLHLRSHSATFPR